jgi:glycosyltransferase A (GT-A) superfamily protein (DUF2064 family)
MTRRAVVLFARTPESEASAKGLPPGATVIFEALIRAWLRAAESAGATPIIACSPADRSRLSAIAPKRARLYVDQAGERFGDRLAGAAAACSRFSPIVIAGIDAPPPDLQLTFDLLERGEVDAAIAPARDGGVNAIGFIEPPLDLLRSFTIGDASLARRCFEFFDDVLRLEGSTDIDSAKCLRAAARERLWRRFRALLGSSVPHAVAFVVPVCRTSLPCSLRAPPQ